MFKLLEYLQVFFIGWNDPVNFVVVEANFIGRGEGHEGDEYEGAHRLVSENYNYVI